MGTVKKSRLELDNDSDESSGTSSDRVRESAVKDGKIYSSNKRMDCEFAINCYRRNPQHLKDYRHPELESLFTKMRKEGDVFLTSEILSKFPDKQVLLEQLKILRNITFPTDENTSSPSTPQSSLTHSKIPKNSNGEGKIQNSSSSTSVSDGGMLSKWEASLPFNFFLTKLPNESSSSSLSVSFLDLFHSSMGKVKSIWHFNYMVETAWFMDQILHSNLEEVQTTIIYGVQNTELESAMRIFPTLKVHLLKSPFPYGHHHTKMSIVKYDDDSLRFIVYTANLIESDWSNRTQGVWIGPKCLTLNDERKTPGEGDSDTNFRFDLLIYLSSYPGKYIGTLTDDIRSCDCSEIRVAFVGSSPVTKMSSITGFNLGLKKMERLLKNSSSSVESDWLLVMQCSSIGTLGADDDWLRNELAAHMKGKTVRNTFPVCLIYPSLKNVAEGIDGIAGGGCLPYSRNTHFKQTWIQNILYQWKSDAHRRTRAMPHIKTYCRISPDHTKMAWFLLTSANLSKAAWGKLNKNRDRLTVMSWEAGVLFIPKFIGSPGQETFGIMKNSNDKSKNDLCFPIPYDLPLTKYSNTDSPWFMDILAEAMNDQS